MLTAYLINANFVEEGASMLLQLGLVDLWPAAGLQTFDRNLARFKSAISHLSGLKLQHVRQNLTAIEA